ncbi:cytochrome c oxidase accessory protein CcoG [Parahaliea maris]|uniref:Cytochrome c oxidase accessory protein CcoG n=1 Tax=Parahaliea maris TaxID=2716870 RepID=A0A5C9A625_9GAMM|nr:cytochrome c oxidase accessory protein CcoG [Parahaliea maris]TXS95489.1 cytochrome c oxidase accessory protein CcoG [Parahaliea maris]
MSDPDLIDVQEVAPAEVGEVDLYQHREKIYTRKIEGFYQRIRLYTGWPLLLGYFLLPWLNIDGRQAILFDLPERKFHILGLTFWPQDFPLLAFLLIIAAYSLFAVTTFAGRVWCGYTCPQTVWTSIFMWIEQKTEGSRNQRMKLDRAPWSPEKVLRKGAKHGGWLLVAFATGFTFIGYFYGIRDLLPDLFTGSAGLMATAWTVFFTCATYINAGWMREQVCTYVCPYARFQSVMFDKDTLIVSYDPARGDPRGSRKRNADHRAEGLGDCIDCELCVQVCPTGIDIRDGLQYQCIGCALCVDACNSIMDKMEYPRGLISYTSEHQLEGGTTHWLRPRIIGYAAMLCLMVGVFTYTIASRIPLEVGVFRDRSQLYTTSASGEIDNIYTLHLANMDAEMHEYELDVKGLEAVEVIGETHYTLNAGEVRELSLRLRMPAGVLDKPSTEIEFDVRSTDNPDIHMAVESRFMIPFE